MKDFNMNVQIYIIIINWEGKVIHLIVPRIWDQYKFNKILN